MGRLQRHQLRPGIGGIAEVTICLDENKKNYRLSIRDHGNGIPQENQSRIFEPFFTTKQDGMGMGLNICRSIAELHRGRLTFEARPGGGTIFNFSLPVTQS